MSWTSIAVLAAGAYVFKAAGVLLGGRPLPLRLQRALALLPAALLPALVVTQTLGSGRALVLDARAAGILAAAAAVWRRAPFPLVIVLAAAVTALVRAVS